MRRYFYIAIKCISSNLYTSDITDIAVLSNSTGELFHREIAVDYSLSVAACQYKYYKYSDTIQYTTGWYDKSTTGCTFSDVLQDLMYFLININQTRYVTLRLMYVVILDVLTRHFHIMTLVMWVWYAYTIFII
jgi:hypothetical protein